MVNRYASGRPPGVWATVCRLTGSLAVAALTKRGVRLSWVMTRAAFAVGLAVAHLGSRKALLPGDVAVVYFNAATHLIHGGVPYVNFTYEYPPGTLPLLALAWLLGGQTRATFVIAWCVLMLVLDGLVTWQLTRSRFGIRAGYVWIIGICLLGPTALLRNDLVVVASFVIAFGLTARKGTMTGGAMWMMGVLAKVWPFAPMAGLLLVRRPGRARLATGALVLLGATAALLIAKGALGSMITNLFSRQGQRPLEIETLWATPVWVKALLTDGQVTIVHTFGSENLSGGQSVAAAATLITAVIQLACIVAPALIARRMATPITAPILAWIFAVYVSATLLSAPVASPQYTAWLLGAACVLTSVAGAKHANRFTVMTLLACALTQVVFPMLFSSLQRADPEAIVALLLRNLTLVAVLAAGVRGLHQAMRQPDETPLALADNLPRHAPTDVLAP